MTEEIEVPEEKTRKDKGNIRLNLSLSPAGAKALLELAYRQEAYEVVSAIAAALATRKISS